MPLSLMLAAAWSIAPSRLWSGFVAIIYYCVASRGLPIGAATYFEINVFSGVVLWVVGCSLLSIPFVIFWGKAAKHKALFFPLILVIVSLPPFGLVGWTNPITSAGIVFPGSGFVGLFGVFLVVSLFAYKPTSSVIVILGVAGLFLLDTDKVYQPSTWEGVNTSEKIDTGSANHINVYLRHQKLTNIANASHANNVLFPESAAGLWTDSSKSLWERSSTNKSVFIGAEVSKGRSSDNVLIRIDPTGSDIIYKQRMPVPISMYRPWSDGGTNAYWFASPVVNIDGLNAGVLICYESLLVWPVLHSAIKADYLISIGNFWWAKDTSIPTIQNSAVFSWAKLFGLPLVSASNR